MNGPPSRELTRQERAAIRRLVTDLCANYDNQDRLCLPLDCPCYMLHKWWTALSAGTFRRRCCLWTRRWNLPLLARTLPETENMPGLWESLSAYYQPGILFGFLPRLCQTEIRAGTQAPDQEKLRVICPQLNPIEACFSRLSEPGLRGGCIRIL